ncbi:MAG: 50S ribosomal protein L31e [Thermofilaceae archaeon]
MADETIYVVPLRDAFRAPLSKRAKVAIRVLREFIMRHTKSKIVSISPEVNEAIWSRGIKRPPRRVKVAVEVREEEGARIAEVRLPKEEGRESSA